MPTHIVCEFGLTVHTICVSVGAHSGSFFLTINAVKACSKPRKGPPWHLITPGKPGSPGCTAVSLSCNRV